MTCRRSLPRRNILDELSRDGSDDITLDYLKQFTLLPGFSGWFNYLKGINARRSKTTHFVIEYEEDDTELKILAEKILALPETNQINGFEKPFKEMENISDEELIELEDELMAALGEKELSISLFNQSEVLLRTEDTRKTSQVIGKTLTSNGKKELEKETNKPNSKKPKKNSDLINKPLKSTKHEEEVKEPVVSHLVVQSVFTPDIMQLFNQWDHIRQDKCIFKMSLADKTLPEDLEIKITPDSVHIKESENCSLHSIKFTLINTSQDWIQMIFDKAENGVNDIKKFEITGQEHIRFAPGGFQQYQVEICTSKMASFQAGIRFITKRPNQTVKEKTVLIQCIPYFRPGQQNDHPFGVQTVIQ